MSCKIMVYVCKEGEERTEGENRAEDVGTSKKGACM